MLAQHRLPGLVAEGLGEAGRPDDVGEHEGLRGGRGPLRRSVRSRSSRSAASRSIRAPSRLNVVERRLQLEIGAVVVVDGAQRARQDRPGSRDLVRRTDLAPALDRRPQLADRGRARRPRPGGRGPAPPGGRTRTPATGSPPTISPSESTAVRAALTSPAAIGDLDLGGQQTGTRPLIPGVLGDGGVDGARRQP